MVGVATLFNAPFYDRRVQRMFPSSIRNRNSHQAPPNVTLELPGLGKLFVMFF
jgi:hypothetical protein